MDRCSTKVGKDFTWPLHQIFIKSSFIFIRLRRALRLRYPGTWRVRLHRASGHMSPTWPQLERHDGGGNCQSPPKPSCAHGGLARQTSSTLATYKIIAHPSYSQRNKVVQSSWTSWTQHSVLHHLHLTHHQPSPTRYSIFFFFTKSVFWISTSFTSTKWTITSTFICLLFIKELNSNNSVFFFSSARCKLLSTSKQNQFCFPRASCRCTVWEHCKQHSRDL